MGYYIYRYSSLQVNDSYFEKQSDTLPGLAYYLEKGVWWQYIFNIESIVSWSLIQFFFFQKCDLVIGPI